MNKEKAPKSALRVKYEANCNAVRDRFLFKSIFGAAGLAVLSAIAVKNIAVAYSFIGAEVASIYGSGISDTRSVRKNKLSKKMAKTEGTTSQLKQVDKGHFFTRRTLYTAQQAA